MHLSEIWHSKKNDSRLSRTQVMTFNVSKEAAKMRLQNEGLLIIDNKRPQRIDRILRANLT